MKTNTRFCFWHIYAVKLNSFWLCDFNDLLLPRIENFEIVRWHCILDMLTNSTDKNAMIYSRMSVMWVLFLCVLLAKKIILHTHDTVAECDYSLTLIEISSPSFLKWAISPSSSCNSIVFCFWQNTIFSRQTPNVLWNMKSLP